MVANKLQRGKEGQEEEGGRKLGGKMFHDIKGL